MNDEQTLITEVPTQSVLTVAHIVYALHTIAIVLGISGAPTIIGSFVGSLPSILAVILNYVQRGEAAGTWAESHYRWQIRTFWFALLVFLGLATKLAIIPLHVWMPWVHAEHPTCIAGLLAVYANIAVYIAVRVLILPLREDLKVFSMPILVFALITMVYGSLLTLAQTDAKRFCACSTISQLSYSVFGIGALTVIGIEGGIFYFMSHILGKAILFSTAGILVYTVGSRDMRKMGGLWSKMPLTAILWICSALILSALPPTSGFVGKWMLFTGAFQGMHQDPIGLVIVILAIISTILTLIYTFLTGIRIFFGPLKPELSNDKIKDPPLTMSLPLLGLAVVAFTLGLYPKPFLALLHSVIGLL